MSITVTGTWTPEQRERISRAADWAAQRLTARVGAQIQNTPSPEQNRGHRPARTKSNEVRK